MNIEEIKEYLPHRYPFLLVDRVLELEPNKYCKGLKNVTSNEPFFQGHFPNHPVMPGVLIVEAVAQVAGILGFKSQEKKPADGWVWYFVGADKVRFKKPVVPGDQLILETTVLNVKRGMWKLECKCTVDEEIVCTAEILVAERKVDA